MKTLIVYATRTGMTRRAAEILAEALNADTVMITDGKDRRGFFGFCAAAVAGLRKTLPSLLPVGFPAPLGSYDRVVVCTPVWSENVCPLARAFLTAYREQLPPTVCYLVTHMAPAPYDKPIAALDSLTGKPATAVLSVQTKNHDWEADVRAYAKSLTA